MDRVIDRSRAPLIMAICLLMLIVFVDENNGREPGFGETPGQPGYAGPVYFYYSTWVPYSRDVSPTSVPLCNIRGDAPWPGWPDVHNNIVGGQVGQDILTGKNSDYIPPYITLALHGRPIIYATPPGTPGIYIMTSPVYENFAYYAPIADFTYLYGMYWTAGGNVYFPSKGINSRLGSSPQEYSQGAFMAWLDVVEGRSNGLEFVVQAPPFNIPNGGGGVGIYSYAYYGVASTDTGFDGYHNQGTIMSRVGITRTGDGVALDTRHYLGKFNSGVIDNFTGNLIRLGQPDFNEVFGQGSPRQVIAVSPITNPNDLPPVGYPSVINPRN